MQNDDCAGTCGSFSCQHNVHSAGSPDVVCLAACLPGAFNTVTGPLHWELLTRARAVDNQCFVMTCSPARNPDAGYQAWGHSTVVGPFAEVLTTCEHEPTTVYAELDFAEVRERRTNLPLVQQKRHDLYELVDKTA